ncbi:type II toxin-antitoxin system VapC family toxin [Xanthobacter sp. 126]|uniref:type II toxin-antitoxin system VapC family toxin n=1 Tax=Xanthobacter sp. 126 TaxID=1131814 RepID=UPI00045E726E|nr:type II toxin-antitoxin system VapC family toxin [Xanthobacter sp. 126]
MSRFVVDASIAIKWFFDEGDQLEAEALAASGAVLLAPELIQTEVANALWKKRRIGAVTVTEAVDICAQVPAFFQRLFPVEPLLPSAIELSFRLDHAIYDCIYLSLARETDCPFLTADGRFARKAAGEKDLPPILPLSDWRS